MLNPSRLIRIDWSTVSSTMLWVGFILQWMLCLILIYRMILVIPGFTIYFYVKLSHDLFEINDFVWYQSSLFSHFTITNYHIVYSIMIVIKVKSIWLRFYMSWFPQLFELIYLWRESFDVMTAITIIKRFYFDLIVSPVVGKTQRLPVICLIALRSNWIWNDLQNCLVLILSTRFMTIIETEYCYLCIQLMKWILFEFIIAYQFQFMIHFQTTVGC